MSEEKTKREDGVALPQVRLEQFLAVCGVKWDQIRAFESHARRSELGPMTVPQWRDAWARFQSRPT